MKNNIILVFIIVLIMVLAACNDNSSNGIEANSSGSGSTNLAVGGSTSGSVAFAYSIAIGNLTGSETDGINMQIQETAGTVDGVRQLIDGGVDIAVSASGTTIDALNGVGPFEATGEYEDLRLLWNLYPSPFNMVVAENSEIDTPEDFVGKSIGAGAPGSGSYIMLVDVLEAYGIDVSDVDLQALTPEEQDTAFRDGHLDIMTFQAGPQTAWLTDLARTRDLKWIQIPEEKFEEMIASQPAGYYVYSELPANSYEGQSEPVKTVGANIEWVANSELDEDTVYEFTKAFWENKEKADEMHTIIAQSSIEDAFGSASTEWHPAVIRYLEEVGIEFTEFGSGSD
ncbi:TAXI family TRAP transporter solute-binding subunit [Oceanobacillus damuensis]|uniref:TAXI family TRAP transporter solute-binding subunit n=1 Tax=Oceanobacillus damuensis TaxID=937928 RepID=UPI000832D662|nr:TAXI family TRAP transporter solute-binding subunit [Oceanobacillus damuensis]